MCGIAGILDPGPNSGDDTRISAMGRTLHHRGPDNFSVFLTGHVALAHNRLSIMDLSPSGNQPFTDGRYSLVYNGEIYNYLDLKRQLAQFPIAYRSTSDTEVLFYHLIHYGIDRTLASAKGMYAFAFFDNLTQTLLLARDRLGIKPLYWCQKDGTLYFASEVKAIAAVTPLTLDPVQTLFSVTGGVEAVLGSSMFRGVRPVSPGTYLTAQPGAEPVESTYYTLREQFQRSYSDELGKLSRHQVNNHFHELLSRSVHSMLMADAPMGIFVSGGVDSSLVAALALQHQRLHLFTSDVRGQYSELKDAECLARTLNADLHVSTFDTTAFLRDLVEATYHYECPVVSFTNAVAFMDVARLARHASVKAVLTGEGADELFHGYPHLLTRRFDGFVRLPLNIVKGLYNLSPKLAKYVNLSAEVSQSEFLGFLSRNFRAQSQLADFIDQCGAIDREEREDYFATIGMCDSHLIGLLHRNDRMGMRASIESRFPFLDEDLVKFAINLPPRFKRRLTWRLHNYKHPFLIDKAPVRDAAARMFPPRLVLKRKWGFGVTAHQGLKVRPGFFADGFVGALCGVTRRGESHLLERMPRYYVGKLVSLEVFGRLFGGLGSMSEVNEALSTFVSVDQTVATAETPGQHQATVAGRLTHAG